MNNITLIIPIHVESPDDEAAAVRMLDSLEADSLGLCQCERVILLSGTYTRQFRGRCHKMASRLLEELPQTAPKAADRLEMVIENERQAGPVVVLKDMLPVEKGWLDRLVIEADKTDGVITRWPATYYPRTKT